MEGVPARYAFLLFVSMGYNACMLNEVQLKEPVLKANDPGTRAVSGSLRGETFFNITF